MFCVFQMVACLLSNVTQKGQLKFGVKRAVSPLQSIYQKLFCAVTAAFSVRISQMISMQITRT